VWSGEAGRCFSRSVFEVILYTLNKYFMVDISGSSYNEVRSNVISGVEFFHVLLSYISDVFPDSVGWLRDVVVSE